MGSKRRPRRREQVVCSATMPFARKVEIGRVGLITYGPDAGKLCTVINILDINRVLVDGPVALTGCHRHELNINRMMLTELTVPVKLNATAKSLKAAWATE